MGGDKGNIKATVIQDKQRTTIPSQTEIIKRSPGQENASTLQTLSTHNPINVQIGKRISQVIRKDSIET